MLYLLKLLQYKFRYLIELPKIVILYSCKIYYTLIGRMDKAINYDLELLLMSGTMYISKMTHTLGVIMLLTDLKSRGLLLREDELNLKRDNILNSKREFDQLYPYVSSNKLIPLLNYLANAKYITPETFIALRKPNSPILSKLNIKLTKLNLDNLVL